MSVFGLTTFESAANDRKLHEQLKRSTETRKMKCNQVLIDYLLVK
ncbi:hypothetical protein VIA_001772 [Vibrio orientalis CIP 102891 = ATCC 33934]|uniref:Uncharacterized protein n=1 Tax=Vibrio orientalis CIP 102891 = ATCC 33934 TaxID=675816 RepID=A0ABP2H2M3_VIBOR|nr:hypothetical protein VIA_001772 [Vibrio orientalis CIP 102891 = ATCC 33934]